MNDADNEGFDLAPQDDERGAATVHEGGRRGEDPDLLLDVSELRVDEISLEVDDLRARVSLRADVLELLKLHVGVEAELGRVQLTIKGVEAEVLLKVRLDNVARIIDRVLTTIDDNPDIIEGLTERVGETAEEAVGSAVEGVGDEAGAAVGEVARGAGQAVDDVTEEARQLQPGEDEPQGGRAKRSPEGRTRRRKADTPRKRSGKTSRSSRDRRSDGG